MKQMEFSPVIFLDTNALHYISSYLRHAQEMNLPPYGEKQTYGEVVNLLREHLPKALVDGVMNGGKTLAFLQIQVRDHEAQIYISRFTKAEVLHGIFDGQAHARLARERMPYRMRQHLRTLGELVSMYLESKDYENLAKEFDYLLENLNKNGHISIRFVEDDGNFSVIADLADFIQSRVFIDVLDAWIYACAIAVQADYLITFDNYLKNVVNKIYNPGNDRDWQEIRYNIYYKLNDVFGVKTTISPSLPLVEKLDEMVPIPWDLSR